MNIQNLPVLLCLMLTSCQSGMTKGSPMTLAGEASDVRLHDQIVGVWLFDLLATTTTHVASRTQYYPDGRFVTDYRISHPGAASCYRETGRWEVVHGLFTEESLHTTNPSGRMVPKLYRRVKSATAKALVLESRTGMIATLTRGPRELEPYNSTFDESQLLRELAMHKMRGFVPVPVRNQDDTVAWSVESPTIEALKR